MRVGQRLEFRDLRCIGFYHREERLKDGSEITRWYYQFAGVDGRHYNYRGKYIHQMAPGCYWNCRATVSYIRGTEVSIKRPVALEAIDGPRLI